MFHICQIIATPFLRFFFPTKFVGKKNLPKGACIIASNHTSNMDVVALATHTWEKKYYLAKKEIDAQNNKIANLEQLIENYNNPPSNNDQTIIPGGNQW